MARKKLQGTGVASTARITRSSFSVLEEPNSEFPALGTTVKNAKANAGDGNTCAGTADAPGKPDSAGGASEPGKPVSVSGNAAAPGPLIPTAATLPGQINPGPNGEQVAKPAGTNPQWAELFRDNRAPSKGA
ncbi:unnamed protein product [Cuscuta europaea]|uniref:Uncharacterized protein n=1 Tax=Cuscuta europaea TaxID=41803 RepID=A0A9P0YM89_CUSEU|nr:unnamed protein product [Cuscuta europaea]